MCTVIDLYHSYFLAVMVMIVSNDIEDIHDIQLRKHRHLYKMQSKPQICRLRSTLSLAISGVVIF